MAKKKTKRKTTTRRKTAKRSTRGRKKAPAELIISKSRTKGASGINVSGEFYGALDAAVRGMIAAAEQRATDNGRKTLRPWDL